MICLQKGDVFLEMLLSVETLIENMKLRMIPADLALINAVAVTALVNVQAANFPLYS
jgi:hypothetical protein